jgi:ABC-type multidrug transport system fused ATPase/permease subunit
MKISYIRENTNEAPLITAMLSVAALTVLLVYYDFSMNIITALAVVILLSLLILASFLLLKHDNKRFIKHRDTLCEEGIACEGKIIGMGTHDELMQTCDEYREISDSQMGGAFLE